MGKGEPSRATRHRDPRGVTSRRPTRVEWALAAIAVVDAGELTWDFAHGSPGTHWVLKLTVLLLAVTGILVIEAVRRLRSR